MIELLIAAADFASTAMGKLIQQFDDGEQLRKLFYDYVRLTHTLEVTFLFPNLTAAEREILVTTMGVRNALVVDTKGHRQTRTPEQQRDYAALMEQQRRQFTGLQTDIVRARLRERLSPLQQQVLDREFLSLPEPAPPSNSPAGAAQR